MAILPAVFCFECDEKANFINGSVCALAFKVVTYMIKYLAPCLFV